MPDLTLSFTETLPGKVWRTLADGGHSRLFVEVRNSEKKSVTFYALDVKNGQWLWKEKKFEEPWWISLAAVCNNVLLFTIYIDTNNPDKKGLLAFDVDAEKILWWKNDFAITYASETTIAGVDLRFGHKEMIVDPLTGAELKKDNVLFAAQQNFQVIRPFQYTEGSANFLTIKSFLEKRCKISPVFSVEYCEHHALILISAFSQPDDLANYLIVFNPDGKVLVKEILGVHLKGIAADTFFIFSGYLFFVKNKCELVSYKLV